MTQVDSNLDNILVDKRVVQRQITNGKLSKEEHESYLAKLPDLEAQCEDITDLIYQDLQEGEEKVSS